MPDMNEPSAVYLRWVDEEVESATGSRRVRVAWLVYDDGQDTGLRYLAYLGQRPAVTPQLIEEVESLYPDVPVRWDAVRRQVEGETGLTDVARLTDDELALGLRGLAAERDLSLTDLSLRLGYRRRYVLGEVLRFLDDPAAVARFERTAGSIFAYLDRTHPEYAYLLLKARRLFSGDEEGLRRLIREEPTAFGEAGARERRAYWRTQLDAYRANQIAPLDGDERGDAAPER
jgi:hypothetical protein